jgi:hypothetical protein
MDNWEETRPEDVGGKDAPDTSEPQCLSPLDQTKQDSMEYGAIERSHLVTDPEYPGREIILEIARKLLDSFEQT